ncbi:MAG: SURF1 family protein [Pseudomonadota bacterium]|nr:SURF1 family protein [Pseudomonadota bacterium]
MQFKFYSKLYSFKPKPFPLIAFLCALSMLISLSAWQFKRLKWKNELIAQRVTSYELETKRLKDISLSKENEFRKIIVEGELLNEYEMFMPALSRNGNNGFHILVPIRTIDGKLIIYDSGWVPLKKKEKNKRSENLIRGVNKFEAVIRTSGRKGYFQPDNDPKSNTWFFVEPEKHSEYTGLELQNNYYLEALNNGPNGLPIGNQTRIYLRNNHLQYALTWLMIGVGLISVFVAANVKEAKK